MFFHAENSEDPVSSSGGTSSAEGPNSTWSVTINPPRLSQTPHPSLNKAVWKASNSQPVVMSLPDSGNFYQTCEGDVNILITDFGPRPLWQTAASNAFKVKFTQVLQVITLNHQNANSLTQSSNFATG